MKKRRRILWKRVVALFFLFTFIIGFGYLYFRTGTLTISSYEVEGAPEEYVGKLKEHMSFLAEQKLFFLLPGNRIISYHDDEIRILIEETLTNTKEISVYPVGLHTLRIRMEPYVPLFSVSDTHAITADSEVYKEIIPLHEYPRLQVASTTAVTKKTFVSLSKLVKRLSTVVFPIKYITIDENDDIRLYDERKKSAIVLSMSSDMDKIWSNVLSAVDTDPLKRRLAKEGVNLEYLDARFGNKLFYKFTDPNVPAIIPTNATTTATTAVQQ